MWISTIFIATLALGSLNLAASEEKNVDEKTVVAAAAASAEKVQEKRQISGHTKVPTKLTADFTPLIYGNQVTPGLGQYAIPDDPATYASSATARKLPNNANSNYLKLAQGQLSPSVAPQQFHVEKGLYQQQQPLVLPQAPRVNTISDAEYLQLIANTQKFHQAAAAQPPQAQHFIPFVPHQGAVLLGQRQYAQLYQKPTGHPLGDSSLEREIEKLVAANVPQQAASSQRQTTKVTKGRQFLPKNQHNFVFIPYQPQALQQYIPQQQQYAAAAAASIPQAALKQQQQQQIFADYQAASKFPQFLPPQQAHFVPILQHQVQPLQQFQAAAAPQHQQAHQQQQQHLQQQLLQQEHALASPIHSYHEKAPQSTPQNVHNTQFPTTKPVDAKKQQHAKPEQPQQKQSAHSSIFVSHSTSTPSPSFASPTKQSHYTAKPASHSQESQQHSSQPASQVSVSSLAESVFKTPPSQQRPLTQQEFQALVDAGYPVTPIHVPVPVPISADKYENHQGQPQAQAYAPQQQYPTHKFAPQTAGSQYQPAILAPATFYAPHPQHQYYQQRQQRDTTKETKP
ncbi:putative mediator of RNA polymerase II transcription subunit 26 [Lutzomyia longipalpis]|uniref:putative mediator of RNA polymerase II transcription subunit 26 n=1 Tax=Lutzomyia longipalpis TaxID=7200 RepID=UPI00248446E5|nr:putative mediator of RNA polymerase II transcription subunit 26 [Lutzomyia longipalpis]